MATMWNLAGLSVSDLGRRVWSELSEDGVLGSAAQLSFYFLLSIFPMFLLLLSLIGGFIGNAAAVRGALVSYLGSVAPENASRLVDTVLQQISDGMGGGGISFAAVVALWAASSGMAAVMNALNRAYEVEETRSWWRTRLVAILLTLALIALIGGALLLMTYGAQIAGAIAESWGLGSAFTTAWRILQWPVLIGFVLLAFNLLYLYAPNIKHWEFHWLMPGTVVGVALWLVASFGFNLYVSNFGSYNVTYGSLGTVVILLLWFYVTGIAILVGAQVNSEIELASDMIGGPEDNNDGEKPRVGGPRTGAAA